MIWKKLALASWARNTMCVILAAAVLLSVSLPALQRQQIQPENNLSDAQIEDITVLQTGEAENLTSYAGAISSKVEGSGSGENGEVSQEDSDQKEDIAQDEKENNVNGQPQPDDTQKDPLSDAAVESADTPSEDAEPSEQDGEQGTEGSEGQEMGENGEEGQQDGDQGEEGRDKVELELGLVMTWFKYGTEAKTIVCESGNTVAKRILTAQLRNDTLRYSFELAGRDAKNAQITSVTCAVGNGVPHGVDLSGIVSVFVPADPGYQNIVFRVAAVGKAQNEKGDWIQQDLEYTFVIRCENGKDLDLELAWEKTDGGSSTVTCAANQSVSREIKSSQLKDGVFKYTTKLLGQLAGDSRLIAGEYRSASGEYETLNLNGGTINMKAAEGSDKETYYLTFTANLVQRDDEGGTAEETVTYTITIVYKDTLDLKLAFTWFEKGLTKRELTCDINKSVSDRVKTNQLSAGALLYEMKLTGESAKDARIKAVALQHNGASESVSEKGSVPMTIAAGESSAEYTFVVTVEIDGQKMTFTVSLRISGDVSLQMDYTIMEEGVELPQQIVCENKRTVTAETVYDDQLTDGELTYTLSLLGEDADGVEITEVKCYQSGSMKTVNLAQTGRVKLLLEGKKTGENTFTVTARDKNSQTYTFTINIPYKHRGDELVKIAINLTDGMEVTNGESVNLTVRAWTEDENGKRVSTIRATGNDTILTVTLDGQEIRYISASGDSQEYTLVPENPEVGDTNQHILKIYAQDEFGNYGETEITLIGKRSQKGQPIGTAMVYVDMTVLGLGVRGPVAYTILSGESAAYVTAKVLWGEDFGDPFGYADQTFSFAGGRTGGTYETGFYLASIYMGGSSGAQALTGRRWEDFGSTEEEILAYIDSRFGKGTGLATLWRCIYRNGLTLGTETPGAIGEFNYTGGSGWLYSVGGGTYYPGQSMSDYYLSNGDILTYRYTLAQGWDVGGGTDNYGNTVGYCVSAANGSFNINHQMNEVTNNGVTVNVCRCCGLQEDCTHEGAVSKDQGNGTHRTFCDSCGEWIGDAAYHVWAMDEDTDSHICECGSSERHDWREQSNTATCVDPGIKTDRCSICENIREQESTPTGKHTTSEKWNLGADGYYKECEICGQRENHDRHEFRSNGLDEIDWWECLVCGSPHFILGHAVQTTVNCQSTIQRCAECGIEYLDAGDGASHQYEGGVCVVPGCGALDPNAGTGETPNPEQPVDPPEGGTPSPEQPTDPPGGDPPAPEQPADPPVNETPAPEQPVDPPAEEGVGEGGT